ncbi:MAG: 3-deoxy-D-manno-octulosonic acid transferase [Minwuia sp.]|uniref:3-deoxy-D-manno-octulosonic acid transferase n=1 Tax=Minwuia sp. TaxID=2493630 RepID=UPI003A872681
MILTAYRLASRVLTPAAPLFLRSRLRNGKEDRNRLGERFGRASLDRPEGPLVWLHAASVGEAQSVLLLIRELRQRRPGTHVLITSGTVTSAGMLAERLPAGVLHQFAPLDLPTAVERFLAHWKPDLSLMIESEIWPNMIRAAGLAGRPLVLINARMSDRSYRRWRRVRASARQLLSNFALILAQNDAAANRFAALGGENVRMEGNLKYAADALPADPVALAALKELTTDRPCWISASIHPGEDRITGEVHRALRQRFPDLLTIMAPRHPDRAERMALLLRADGTSTVRRSETASPAAGCEFYIADTIGEMGTLYSLEAPVFVGGSLVPHGGQNVLEPARFGRCILTGPHTQNFADVIADMRREDAMIEVENAEELTASLARLLQHKREADILGARARLVAGRQAAVLERVLARLEPLLPAS